MLALLKAGELNVVDLVDAFEEIVPRLEREAMPRVQEGDFRRKLDAFLALAKQNELGPATEQQDSTQG